MTQQSSRWQDLLGEAYRLIDAVNRDTEVLTDWTFGGGTSMMIQLDHRESYDIDLFLDDPQLLPYVAAAVGETQFVVGVPTHSGDGSRHLKIAFEDIGEIDFIVAGHVTTEYSTQRKLLGRIVSLETVAEVIAKKIRFRGASIQPRDIFDIAVACEAGHRDDVSAILPEITEYARATSDKLSNLTPDYVESNLRELMIRPKYEALIPHALPLVIDLLKQD